MKDKFLKIPIYLLFSSAFFIVLSGCDLSPRINEELVAAQERVKSQDYKEAAFIFERILHGNVPKDLKIKIYYQLAEINSLNFKNYQQAIFYYDKLARESEDPKWQIKAEERKADIYFLFLRNYKDAIVIYKKLISFSPRLENYNTFIVRLGQSYLYVKDFLKAEEVFKEISKEQDRSLAAKSFYFLGLLNFYKSNYPNAISFWRDYLKIETSKEEIVQTKFLIANAYETMEELKKAYNLYYSLMGEYPNTSVLKQRLNSIYSRRIARKR